MISKALESLIFNTKDYRKVMGAFLREKGRIRGYRKRLADAAQMQAAYLSQVLNGKAELTPEQAERIGQFWELPELESEQFYHLVLLERAGSESLRKRIRGQMAEIREKWQNRNATFERPSLSDDERAQMYYSHWKMSAVHALLLLPELRTAQALAQRLHVGVGEVEEILGSLATAGLAAQTGGRWQSTRAQIHASHLELFSEQHHRNWRIKGLERRSTQAMADTRYTSVHTISRADYTQLRHRIEDLIREAKAIVGPSQDETCACLTIDYFELY